jgi:hypothetical protein
MLKLYLRQKSLGQEEKYIILNKENHEKERGNKYENCDTIIIHM